MVPRSFRLGDFTIHIIFDGSRSIGSMTMGSARSFIFGDAPEADVEEALRSYGGINSNTVIPFNYILAEREGHVTLVDTGCGDQAENKANPEEPAGFLVENLSEAGFGVGDVHTVIISHSHWDHFGGAVTDGKPTFPKADYVISEKEVAHIEAKEGWAHEYLRALEGRLRRTTNKEEVDPGVVVSVTPGHTPGITITELTSSGRALLYTSDIVIHQAHIEHLDWIPNFETNKGAAANGRRRLVEDAYRRRLILFVPHIESVLGMVEKGKTGYRWATRGV